MSKLKTPSSLELYTRAAEQSSNSVIANYSTSFGWATKLLAPEIRQNVRNIYALVRVADEIVDGAAEEALVSGGKVNPAFTLDTLEQEVYSAMANQFSANLVVHAFAKTANETGFTKEIIEPFFESMRMDLTETVHDEASFDRYVYGSAEVVGLMCLYSFVSFEKMSKAEFEKLVRSARALGAAFQKVNFLRDLAADFEKLGRSYFPKINPATFNEADKARLIEFIRQDLRVSSEGLAKLPASSRKAVSAAQLLFSELADRIEKTPAEKLMRARISVPNSTKAIIILKSLIGVVPK